MKIFNQTFKSINEKQLVYKYIEYLNEYKRHGYDFIYSKLKDSSNEEDRLLHELFQYEYEIKKDTPYDDEQYKQIIKEHIDQSLSERRLKDLLTLMGVSIEESIARIKERLPAYFVGEDFDTKYMNYLYNKEYYYKDDPTTWFADIEELKKEIVFFMEKFFEEDEQILAVEKYIIKSKFRVFERFMEMIVDGYNQSFIEDEMKIVQKYAIKYILLKHSKKGDVTSLAVEFEYAFTMVIDFINFIYQRTFGRQELRLYYENKEQLNDRIEDETEEIETKEPVRALSAEEIEALIK